MSDDPPCRECERPADFWLYHPDDDAWQGICERDLVHLHPSIELHAWLESGYATPTAVARPTGPPSPPQYGRAAAFRELVDDALD